MSETLSLRDRVWSSNSILSSTFFAQAYSIYTGAHNPDFQHGEALIGILDEASI